MTTEFKNKMPVGFTLEIEDQEGEIFKRISKDLTKGLHYEISNLGRVRSHVKADPRIMLSYRVCDRGNFHVKLNSKQFRVIDLLYFTFIGQVPEQCRLVCSDGNNFNLNVKNVKPVLRPDHRRKKKTSKPRVNKVEKVIKELEPPYIKPLFVSIDINQGDKETQIAHINAMKPNGYCLVISSNGIYDFKLVPKEGDTVRVLNSEYTSKATHRVTKKDGIKYSITGYEETIYFLAQELEIIKQA